MTTITPTAVDAYVFIEAVKVLDRHRKDLGDLVGLAESIEDVGLLNPITITPDDRLVAGQRRLEACRLLGWDSIPVRIAKNLSEMAALLIAERDENTQRKEMLPSELASLGAAMEAVEAVAARERQRAAGRENGRGIAPSSESGSYGDEVGEVASIVGESLGVSRATYYSLAGAYRTANDEELPAEERALGQEALDAMDAGRGVQPAYREMRGRLKARREAQEVKAAAQVEPPPVQDAPAEGQLDPSWIPHLRDNSATAVQQRRKLIAFHADRGLSSRQIAETIGVADDGVRKIAKKHGITIPADALVGRTKRIDSNRVVRETVYSLEGSAMAVQLVNVAELDRAEIGGWTASLTESIRALNRLVKQLKELAS